MPPADDEAPSASPAAVRRAAAADLPHVVRIWHEGWGDAHIGHVPGGLLTFRQRTHFEARAGERVDATWVAVVHGVVAGFVVVKHDEVEQLYVDRIWRGSGVAATLLRAAEAEVGRGGYPRAWLAVVAGNTRARAFYARRGWRDAGPMEYLAQTADGPYPVPTHRYERDVSMPTRS
jgi:GNAT superfamily N-acetyltransferase